MEEGTPPRCPGTDLGMRAAGKQKNEAALQAAHLDVELDVDVARRSGGFVPLLPLSARLLLALFLGFLRSFLLLVDLRRLVR